MNLDDITYKINGCAMKVHRTLGNGFQEVIYQRCLAIELTNAALSFVREQEQIIFYNNTKVGSRRADFVIEGRIIVEIKALINLEDVHLSQAKNYLVAYNFPVGLLINFGSARMQVKKCLIRRLSESGWPGFWNEQDIKGAYNLPILKILKSWPS